MHWFLLAILTAVAVAGRDVSVKKLSAKHSAMEIAAIELFWSIPFFLFGLYFTQVPPLDDVFWWNFVIAFPFNCFSYLLYVIALTLAPLSLTVPLLSFTPVFVILTGALVLNEHVNIYGFCGIILIVLSSYLLNFNKAQKGYLKPIIAIYTEKGSLLMFIVAFLFSIAGVVGKKAIVHSSPLFFGYFFFLVCNVSILCGILLCSKVTVPRILQHTNAGIWLGSLFFVHIMFHCLAIIGTNAAYMISIKRSSILFSVVLGWLFFKEEHFKFRGPAAFLMFIGALLITFLG